MLLGAIALDLFAVLFAGAVALLPAIAEDRLGVGNVGYGWLRAAPGIGGVLVTASAGGPPVARHVGRTLYVAVAVFAVMTIVLGVTTQLHRRVRRAARARPAPTRSACSSARRSCRWRRPTACAAASLAVENVFIGASNELGAFESGVAATLLGVGPAVTLGGVLTLGVVGLWCLIFPELRDVDRFAEIEAPESSAPDGSEVALTSSPGGLTDSERAISE